MNSPSPIICSVRYTVDLNRLDEFKSYAEAWLTLVNRYGGQHQGYFLSVPSPVSQVSFPGLGRDGPADVVLATFTFPDLSAYEEYRLAVRTDPLCTSAEAIVREGGCVVGYERIFLQTLVPSEHCRNPD